MLTPADIALHVNLGIEPTLLASMLVTRVDDRGARDVLGVNGRPGELAGLLYPYLIPGRPLRPVTHRLRRDHPDVEGGLLKNKYLSAFSDHRHLYFATIDPALLADTSVPALLVEAEKSALAIASAARRCGRPLLAVGLGGCWGWRGRIGKTTDVNGARVDELGPLPDFHLVTWTDRDTILAFDANAATNTKVQAARRALARELASRGARVRILALPVEPGVNGPDDYIGRHHDQAFFALFEAAAPDAPPVFALTDCGNSEFLAFHYGPDLRFDHRRGRWLVWKEQRWQPDADASVYRLAKAAMRQRLREAAALQDSEARARLVKWALSSESRGRLEATIHLARSEPPIADAGDAWDALPMLLAAPNGTVDLETGRLRAARREDRITLGAGVDYDADARSALWEDTLRRILIDDAIIDFFQVAVGYSATGDTRRDCWFLACGSGRNGKGTLLQPIRHALGDYALELPGAVFDLRSERSPYELAYLPGKRFVTSSEAGDTLRLHHDRIKQLSGGDSMSAANKYEKGFEFEPTCKLWLACNKRPRITDDTAAFWARVFLIPFTVSFVGKEDRSLRPALVQERAHQAAVLAWIVRGAMRYQAEGLVVPASINNATREFERESDPLADFLEEDCEREPASEVRASELFEHYRRWADRQGLGDRERLSATLFGRRMGERFARVHTRDGGVYRGVGRR